MARRRKVNPMDREQCPGCGMDLKPEDCGEETRVVTHKYHGDERFWHRTCRDKQLPNWALMTALFRMQDDWNIDAQTALADMLADIAHWAADAELDFEDAVERAKRYVAEEI